MAHVNFKSVMFILVLITDQYIKYIIPGKLPRVNAIDPFDDEVNIGSGVE